MRFIGFLAISWLVVLTTAHKQSHGKVIVCPVITQSILDTFLSEFNIEKADWNLCTHLIVIDHQFVGLEEVPNEQKESDYEQITNLKKKYQHLTITVAVPLIDLYKKYRAVENNSNALENFLQDIVNYATTRNFDGFDLNLGDLRQGLQKINEKSSESGEIFDFLNALAKSARSRSLILTLSLSITVDSLLTKSDIAKYAKYVEFIHLFQLRTVSDRDHSKKNTIGDALQELNPSNVQRKVDYLITSGVPTSKIVLGINFGGPSARTTLNGNLTEAKTERIVGYNSICELLSSPEAPFWQKSYHNDTKLSILIKTNKGMNETTLILCGRSRTVANYMKLIAEKNLAGALAFAIDMDDFKGQCGIDLDTFDDFELNEDTIATIFEQIGPNYPLLKTMKEALQLSVDKMNPPNDFNSNITGPMHGKVVACPIVTQSVINTYGNEFSIENANWALCTHVIVIDDKFVGVEGVADEQRERDYKQLTDLRTKFTHLKISLAVSMVTFYEKHLIVSFQPNAARNHLAVISNYLEQQGFDGLDLNFADLNESFNAIEELSVDNDTVFDVLKELRENLQAQNLLLTSSFSATIDFFSTKFDFSKYAEYFDLVHLFSLPAISNRDRLKSNTIGHALRELNLSNVQRKVDYLIASGIPAQKIVLGVNFGGPCATTALNGNITEAQTERIVGFNLICEILSSDEATQWVKSYDHNTGLSILTKLDNLNNQTHIILYGRSHTVANYVNFARQRGLAGALVFAIDMDDYNGLCNVDEDTFDDFEGTTANILERNRKDYPLLWTVNSAMSVIEADTTPSGSGQTGTNDSTTAAAARIRNPFYIVFDILGDIL